MVQQVNLHNMVWLVAVSLIVRAVLAVIPCSVVAVEATTMEFLQHLQIRVAVVVVAINHLLAHPVVVVVQVVLDAMLSLHLLLQHTLMLWVQVVVREVREQAGTQGLQVELDKSAFMNITSKEKVKWNKL
jgi:hypothetical protein